ncbi:MAG: GNAT family N-acetyltransferase [Streptosporangiales bacterium]|nr:GNAT family N-acetyltransferase [Streptosporangiales bacterium]
MVAPTGSTVASVRAFNRFYTGVIGVLEEGVNKLPYSLTEGRVLYELGGQDRLDVVDLRRRLDLDPGYLTRILGRLAEADLVTRERSSDDGRRQVVELTHGGKEQRALLDEGAQHDIAELLDPLTRDEQRRLVAAMQEIRALMDPEGRAPAGVRLRDAEPGDLGWVVQRNAVVYTEEYDWDQTYEALVARIVADFGESHDPVRERLWIAEVDGRRAGCVFCVRSDDETAKLRLLLVDPSARGHGVGGRLVEACVDFARQAGYRRMVLWTNSVLVAARHLYERAGFTLVEEEHHVSFGKELVGQTWSLDLA